VFPARQVMPHPVPLQVHCAESLHTMLQLGLVHSSSHVALLLQRTDVPAPPFKVQVAVLLHVAVRRAPAATSHVVPLLHVSARSSPAVPVQVAVVVQVVVAPPPSDREHVASLVHVCTHVEPEHATAHVPAPQPQPEDEHWHASPVHAGALLPQAAVQDVTTSARHTETERSRMAPSCAGTARESRVSGCHFFFGGVGAGNGAGGGGAGSPRAGSARAPAVGPAVAAGGSAPSSSAAPSGMTSSSTSTPATANSASSTSATTSHWPRAGVSGSEDIDWPS
jgi:hypothetical protein